jgi:hypothetical protein
LIAPPVHTKEELEAARQTAISAFRKERLEEPLEDYLEAFDEYLGTTEDLLEATVDLADLQAQAVEILSNEERLRALRYLAGPPISLDDLKTLASVGSLTKKKLKADPDTVKRLIEIVQIGLDRRRFPWVTEGREPTEAERQAAVLASAALMATARVGTKRRSTSKEEQEAAVEAALITLGWKKVETRTIKTLADAPVPGEFCRESMLGTRKADFVVRLHDGRIFAIECKVSNSSTNSVKRLNNDAAKKAVEWNKQFGTLGIVPSAVLSGVYKLHNLESAQGEGLALFWAHDLVVLTNWIQSAT